MHGDQVEGSVRETGEGLREGLGGVMGDDHMKAEGVTDQAKGAIQHGYGHAKEGAKTLADGAPAFDEIIAAARQIGRRSTGRCVPSSGPVRRPTCWPERSPS